MRRWDRFERPLAENGHGSWLLAGGADLQIVKERLGHVSIATTEKYLHRNARQCGMTVRFVGVQS